MIGHHEYEYTSLDHAIFNASLKAANVTFSTRLEHAMRADDVSKAKEIISKEFRKYGDSPVSMQCVVDDCVCGTFIDRIIYTSVRCMCTYW